MIMWELNDLNPPKTLTYSDVAMFLRRESTSANGDDADISDTLFHMFSYGFDCNSAHAGYTSLDNAYCMIPNICCPRSRGRIYLHSADPDAKPALYLGYLSDPERDDLATLRFEVRAERKMAAQSPFKDKIKREIAPGANVQSDEAIDAYNRAVPGNVYHPGGTARMGNTTNDPLTVVDSGLKVKGTRDLRMADAGILPIITP